ncbi:MAG: iron hydrogenase small subunit [Desulfovibrio sp.]|jgi:ferredoxin hydrogenase small subunit|nr:iron hydrogenase small subunit [Desulfovibrio sp.]
MNTVTVTRRCLLKAGMALGLAALFGIRMTSKAAAAVTELKSFMQKRLDGVYGADRAFPARASQDNAQVRALYAEFLHKPGSRKAHDLLHMHFVDRSAGVVKLQAEGKTANRGAGEFPDSTYPYEWVS